MQEFSSISVSTYNPDELAGQLNEQVKEGWSVVAIVPTGSTVTAYLSRESTGEAPAATVAAASAAAPAAEPAAEPSHFEVAGIGAEPATPEPAAEPAEPTLPTAAEPAAAAAAPAGWYADPSARFELRYWDGTTWTEPVSRGGQQFTVPPVA